MPVRNCVGDLIEIRSDFPLRALEGSASPLLFISYQALERCHRPVIQCEFPDLDAAGHWHQHV